VYKNNSFLIEVKELKGLSVLEFGLSPFLGHQCSNFKFISLFFDLLFALIEVAY
jgi:hypothetical protein